MANIHVLTQDGSNYSFLFHVAVPGGVNASGIAWSTVLVNHAKLGGRTGLGSVLPAGDGTAGTVSAAELAAIVAGTILEVPYTWNPQADFEQLSGPNQQAAVDLVYAQVTQARLNDLAHQLNRFGLTLT